MKKIILLLSSALVILSLQVEAAKITSDELNLGKPGSSSDKTINFGSSRFIRSNETTGKLEFSNDSGTIIKEIGSGSGSGAGGGINLLSNSSFEDGSPPQDWTNTGGTFTQETFSNPSDGDEKFSRFVATGAGQFIESALVTVPDDFSFGMMADTRYTSGSSSFDLVILDSTGSITYSSSSFNDNISWDKKATDTFQTPAAGSQIKMRIVSTGAGTIDLNKAYLGSNKGFIPADFQGETVEKILSVDQQINGTVTELTITGLELGATYELNGRLGFYENIGQVGDGGVRAYNGAQLVESYKPQMQSTIDGAYGYIQESPNARFNATDTELRFDMNFSGGAQGPVLRGNGTKDFTGSFVQLTKISSKSVQAFTPEQASFLYMGTVERAAGPVTVTGSTDADYLSPSNSTLNLNNIVGSAKITCSGTNPSTGTTCSVGNESFGVSLNLPVAGKYKVCAKIPNGLYLNSSSGITMSQVVVHTALNDDTYANRIAVGEKSNVFGGFQNVSPNSIYQFNSSKSCGFFDIGSAGEHQFRYFKKNTCVSGTCNGGHINTGDADDGDGVTFTVEMMQNNVARPVIQNMVDTKTGSGLRIQTCTIDDGTTATFVTDDCNDWIDSLNEIGPSNGDIVFKTGIFSKPPSCNIQSYGANNCFSTGNTYSTSSQVRWEATICNSGAANNTIFNITCIGER